MAPKNVPIDDYHSRFNALYETLDNILHPMPKEPYKRWREEKMVIAPDFAPPVGKSQGKNKPLCRPNRCIYFEKLNKEEHKAVSEALIRYVQGHDSFALLPPRYCINKKKCQGHHYIDDIVGNSLPKDLSHCYVYFFA